MARRSVASPRFMAIPQAAARATLQAVRGAFYELGAKAGRIVMKPCRDSITRERRKLKKMARMVAEGVMTPEQVQQSYQSWRGGMAHLDAHRSVLAMDALYRSLFENLAGGGCSMQSSPRDDSGGTPSP